MQNIYNKNDNDMMFEYWIYDSSIALQSVISTKSMNEDVNMTNNVKKEILEWTLSSFSLVV